MRGFRFLHASPRKFTLLAALLTLSCPGPALATDMLPLDPRNDCPLSQTDFNAWFESGTAATDGIVKPANSITFTDPGNDNCNFHRWAEQMWLWATSPAPASYGGTGRVFASNAFFDVSEPDPNDNFQRHLMSHATGFSIPAGTALTQFGPNALPQLRATNSKTFEIVNAPLGTGGNSMIRNTGGQFVEIGRIQQKGREKAQFFDSQGAKIDAAFTLTYDLLPPTVTQPLEAFIHAHKGTRHAVIHDVMARLNKAVIAESFVVAHRPIVVNFGTQTIVEIGTGEAQDGGVLMTQAGEIVYYGIHVNDVFAYYLTGRKNGAIAPTFQPPDTGKFPTTQGELTAVKNAFPNKVFPDEVALAVEMKTAWVRASSLPDPQNYIRRTFSITDYPNRTTVPWPPGPRARVSMALVAAHLVGSLAGHPEMVWATYDHVNNAPHARFRYIDNNSVDQLVAINDAPNTPPWLFYNNSGLHPCPVPPNPGDCNIAEAHLISGNAIDGNPEGTSTMPRPSELMRVMSFGASADNPPDLITSDVSNTQVISLNNHVQGMLPGDVRSNYVFVGATWTVNGAPPNGSFTVNQTKNEIGTSALAGLTLESFKQGGSAAVANNPNPTNCFACHGRGSGSQPGTNTTRISHIFGEITPLP